MPIGVSQTYSKQATVREFIHGEHYAVSSFSILRLVLRRQLTAIIVFVIDVRLEKAVNVSVSRYTY